MTRYSLRWRLPLTYALIALFTAGALGGVLIAILNSTFTTLEARGFQDSLTAAERIVAELLREEVSRTQLDETLSRFALMARVRLRLLNEDSTVFFDSGLPSLDLETDALIRGTTRETVEIWRDSRLSTPDAPLILETENTVQDEIFAIPGVFGFELGTDTQRFEGSSARVNLFDATDDEAIWLELTHFAGYSKTLLLDVVKGWTAASLIAVGLAVVVGWYISQTITAPLHTLTHAAERVAEGELDVRVELAVREDEFGTLASAFNTMAARVAENVGTLRRFVADAAHELQTPLTALRTNLELAAHDRTNVAALRRALDQLARMETLTRGLLVLSRVEHTQEEVAPVDLNALIVETAALYASRAEQAGIDLRIVQPGVPVFLPGNAAQLRQAVSNLIDNALKFSPEGGRIKVGVRPLENQVTLWVEDEGIGIPPEDLPYLFDRFHRGRNAASYSGSGLGLAIVRAIIERHGGTVRAENNEKGARFTVFLPC